MKIIFKNTGGDYVKQGDYFWQLLNCLTNLKSRLECGE